MHCKHEICEISQIIYIYIYIYIYIINKNRMKTINSLIQNILMMANGRKMNKGFKIMLKEFCSKQGM
jgi:hypothetical protein